MGAAASGPPVTVRIARTVPHPALHPQAAHSLVVEGQKTRGVRSTNGAHAASSAKGPPPAPATPPQETASPPSGRGSRGSEDPRSAEHQRRPLRRLRQGPSASARPPPAGNRFPPLRTW